MISRRIFCRFAALGSLSATIPPANDEPSASLLYEQGVRMLREGRTFEKAAVHFALSLQKEPCETSHQIALGCAWASRAASLAHAALFTQVLANKQAEFP